MQPPGKWVLTHWTRKEVDGHGRGCLNAHLGSAFGAGQRMEFRARRSLVTDPGGPAAEPAAEPPFGVFSVAEFRALWLAYAQSIVGDQLARVALAVLVFDRTRSAAWTAATYSLTYLPALVSGVLLTGLADRLPRRTVMVGADVTRAVLVAVMAMPGLPLPVLACVLVLVELAEAPFGAAQGALLPAIVGDHRYEQGQRIVIVTHQAGQLAGFAAGGVLVAWLGPHLSLAVNALTFLASALLVAIRVRARPAAARPTSPGSRLVTLSQVRDSARLIWTDARLRALVCLGWLAGFTIVPEGLAVPLADQVGAGAAGVGLLLAAKPAGTLLGAYVLGRAWIGQSRRLRWLGPLAVCASLPNVLYLLGPTLTTALVLPAVSGLFAAYQITAGATFVRLTPDDQRGQALGLARSGLVAVQGVGIAASGAIAQWSGGPAGTIGAAGIVGTVCAVAAATAWSRADPRRVATTLTGT
jgi:predicted MFS family arabinose efflux permease